MKNKTAPFFTQPRQYLRMLISFLMGSISQREIVLPRQYGLTRRLRYNIFLRRFRMTISTQKVTAAIILFIFVTPLIGCYQHITLKKFPPNSDALLSIQHSKRLPPAYLMSIQVELNGSAVNANPSFEQRFVGRLQEIGLFEDVVGTTGRPKRSEEPHYKLFLKVSETQHLDRVGNTIKGFFVGLTLFLLSPVLPMDYGHEVNMTLVKGTQPFS